jgi:HAD superfamily hydrolase (TIGR01490 family)
LNNNYQHCKAFLFDLDHTLLQVNTSFRFGVYLFKKKVLSFPKMTYLLACYAVHLMGGLSIASIHHKTLKAFFEGRSLKELDSLVQSFLDLYLSSMQNHQVVTCLRNAQKEGCFVAILSSSPELLVKAIAERFKVPHYLATRYSLSSDGTIGGLLLSVQGTEKASYVKQLSTDFSLSCEQIAAFSDSFHDLPFLQAVGCPVAVNPDRRLRQWATKSGWTILH